MNWQTSTNVLLTAGTASLLRLYNKQADALPVTTPIGAWATNPVRRVRAGLVQPAILTATLHRAIDWVAMLGNIGLPIKGDITVLADVSKRRHIPGVCLPSITPLQGRANLISIGAWRWLGPVQPFGDGLTLATARAILELGPASRRHQDRLTAYLALHRLAHISCHAYIVPQFPCAGTTMHTDPTSQAVSNP